MRLDHPADHGAGGRRDAVVRPAARAMVTPGAGRGDMTPSERVLRARLAAYTMHARYDTRETTAAARAAFLDRFEHEVDPDGTLSAAERQRPRRRKHARRTSPVWPSARPRHGAGAPHEPTPARRTPARAWTERWSSVAGRGTRPLPPAAAG